MLKKKNFVSIMVMFLFISVFHLNNESLAEKYPEKAITMSTTSDAGSPADIYTRQVAKLYEKYLKVPVVVVNKPGGNAAENYTFIKNNPADGYVISSISGSHPTYISVPNFPMTPNDIEFIGINQIDYYVIAVRGDSPFKTWKDVVNYAKKNPGKLSCAGVRVGSTHHQNFDGLITEDGIDIIWVPNKGGTEAKVALLGGHSELYLGTPGSTRKEVEAGKMRVLIVFSDERSSVLPNSPCLKELGYKFEGIGQIRGIICKKGVPKERLTMLSSTLEKITKDPDYVKYNQNVGSEARFMGPEKFEKWFKDQVVEVQDFLKKIGVKK